MTDGSDEDASTLAKVKDQASGRWARLNARHPWIRHTVAAWKRMQENNGNLYAGAITYFSFLALFPLLLLAVSVTGFVLHSHPAAQQDLFDHITKQIPGSVGNTLSDSLKSAINARTSVGLIGLAGVLFTGLGWIGNLRAAIDAVWGRRPAKRSFPKAKAADLGVLVGLGLGILVSLGLTVVGTSLTDQILRAIGLGHVFGLHIVVKIVGIALALVGDLIIFLWLLVRLPQVDVSRRVALRGAVLAAVGFEILKIVGTFTIARTAHSPTAGPFAGILAVLIWIQLVTRFMLFCAAWMATLHDFEAASLRPQPALAPSVPDERSTGASVWAIAWSWFGAGAAAGSAIAGWAASRRRAAEDRA